MNAAHATARELAEELLAPSPPDVRLLCSTWQTFARPSQLRPAECKRTWHVRAGRGFGKDRLASEATLDQCEDWGPQLAGAILSRTADEVLEVMVRGPSGLLACARRRGYEIELQLSRGSAGVVQHPAGGELRIGSGEIVDGVRGPNLNYVWGDEIASWRYGPEVLANVEFALRAPAPEPGPWSLFVGTPHHASRVRFDPTTTTLTTGSMDENAANLAPSIVAELRRKHRGSPLEKQELDGIPVQIGGLVDRAVIHANRVEAADVPELESIVVGVDPGGQARDVMTADLTGIVVVGRCSAGELYVLADYTVAGAADVWARVVIDALQHTSAGSVVCETNAGGTLVLDVIRRAAHQRGISIVVEPVCSTKSKLDRALPFAQQAALNRVHFVGVFDELEDQCAGWSPRSGKSPDRLDALVHAANRLIRSGDDTPHLWE